jgi:hypothetical protein
MQQLWTWLLGLGVIGYLISIWFRQKQHQDNTSQFFSKVLDAKIDDRQQAIQELTRKQSETLEAYYAKVADYNRKHGTNFPTGES